MARAAERFVVVADETKLVSRLGERAPLPVEVIPFARPLCERLLVAARLAAGAACATVTARGSPTRAT